MENGTGAVTLKHEFNGYSDFKARLDSELKANVEGFVRIGYLLKVARDTDILKESGHRNVAEFAAAEYGLTKDVVSRYIAINDRYSENGYSDKLLAKFEGYGVSKLSEMLTLPDYIIDEITPTLTRAEILEIKAEVKAEEQVSPIEVAIEAAAPEAQKEERELSFPERVWKAYFSGDAGKEEERFRDLDSKYYSAFIVSDEDVKQAKEKFFDTFGGKILWARVQGVGRIMIAVSGEADDKITFTNSRSGEKQTFTGEDAIADIKELIEGKGCTEEVFEELFMEQPKEEPKQEVKVAPVQPVADFMPEPVQVSGENEQIPEENAQKTEKSVQIEAENEQKTEKSVQTEQGENDHEKECSKEPADGRSESNEDRQVSEGTENGEDKTENERSQAEVLGKLEVGDRIVNLKDGTRGTMLGYCAGEYKISTENGLTLVNEKSTNWKKEEIADAEYREAEGEKDNDRSNEGRRDGAEGTEGTEGRAEAEADKGADQTQEGSTGQVNTDNADGLSDEAEYASDKDSGLDSKESVQDAFISTRERGKRICSIADEWLQSDSVDFWRGMCDSIIEEAQKIIAAMKEVKSRKEAERGND